MDKVVMKKINYLGLPWVRMGGPHANWANPLDVMLLNTA